MFDCHIHMVLDGVNWRESIARHKAAPQEALIRKTLAQYQALGYTYLRDGGDRWGAGALAAKLAPEYGIRYRTPCFPIYKTGHYGSFIGRGFSTPAEYRALVRAAKAAGAHFIKIMISGLMDFEHYGVLTDEPLAPGEIADMIAGAHDEGFSVMAHANGDSAVRAALAAGVDSIEHGAYLSPETRSQLAESHAVWVPTLVTIGNLIGDGRFPDAALRPLLAFQQRSVRDAAAQGARIACGSDAGAYRVLHAQGGLEQVLQLETHLDHLSGEELGLALTALTALPETLDVLWLPGIGKKNRPAGLLRVLCRPADGESVSLAILRHTHSLGLRRQRLERLALPREAAGLHRAGETLEAKAYTLEGRRYVRAEADAVKAAAARLGVGAPALRFGE